MKNLKRKFEEFQNEKISSNQQKKVKGGDGIDPDNDPSKKGGGNGNP